MEGNIVTVSWSKGPYEATVIDVDADSRTIKARDVHGHIRTVKYEDVLDFGPKVEPTISEPGHEEDDHTKTTASVDKIFDHLREFYDKIPKRGIAIAVAVAVAVLVATQFGRHSVGSDASLANMTARLNELNTADVPLLTERSELKTEISEREKKVSEIEKAIRANAKEKSEILAKIASFKK